MTNPSTAQAVMQGAGFEIRVVVSASGFELHARLLEATEPSVAAVAAGNANFADLSPQEQAARQNSFSGQGRETALLASDSFVWDPSQGDLDNHGGWNVADGGEPVGAEPVADDDSYDDGYDETYGQMDGAHSYGPANSSGQLPAGTS